MREWLGDFSSGLYYVNVDASENETSFLFDTKTFEFPLLPESVFHYKQAHEHMRLGVSRFVKYSGAKISY